MWLLLAAAAPLSAMPAFAQENGEPADPPAQQEVQPGAVIDDVGNQHRGIFHFNQDAGDTGQQANVAALAAVSGTGAAVADAVSSQHSGATLAPATPTDASMTNVAGSAAGIIGINQSAAAGSQQSNTAAIALATGPGGIALASAASAGSMAGSPLLTLSAAPSAFMDAVGNAASGIVQINQIAGVGGSQSNLVAIAAAPGGAAMADITSGGDRPGDSDSPLPATAGPVSLTDSFNAASGLVQINQASGSGNAQTNLLAAAFGSYADAQTVSDTGLGQATASPAGSTPPEGEGRVTLANSFDGFSGVAQVSQVSGHGNQTTNTISAAIGSIAGGGAP